MEEDVVGEDVVKGDVMDGDVIDDGGGRLLTQCGGAQTQNKLESLTK